MAVLQRSRTIGLNDNGMLMTPAEFDRADFDEQWKYELVNGVLIVTPWPGRGEVDPNEELGRLLRNYRDEPGSTLNLTLPEQFVRTEDSRRRADRLIWAGLGRKPRLNEKPTIAVEFVSKRKRDRRRDYETKRDEYLALGIAEYWVIDRFARTMTVFSRRGNRARPRIIGENETYSTPLLPGFELSLGAIFERADLWANDKDDDLPLASDSE